MRTLLLLTLSGVLLCSQSPAQDAATGPTRIAGGVIAGSKVGGDNPRYPAEAKAKGVSGTVHMHAVIDKKGKVEKVSVIDGPDLLRDAAVKAVSTWKYKPYLLNGRPTEVDTTITVNFTFGGSPPPPAATETDELAPGLDAFEAVAAAPVSAAPVNSVRISGGVLALMRLGGKQPRYPLEAKQGHISGSVILSVVIGPDGHMQKVEAMSGPNELRDASVEGVETWYYKPYLLNGQPVSVSSTVTVNYSIGR